MNLRSLIWKEMWQRPTPMLTSLLAVALGVTALVAIQNITVFSEQEIKSQMESLGANVLVLPSDVSLENYYAADMHGQTIPEEYVTRLALARMPGVENLAPKLCVPAKVGAVPVTLTGILPKSDFAAKSAWQGMTLLANPVGTERGCCPTTISTGAEEDDPASLVTTRTIQNLDEDAVILGSNVAKRLAVETGDSLTLLNEEFHIRAVMPPTGTVDDSRVFTHLHTAQRISESGPVVNVIEIMACCEDAAGNLITDLETALPETSVITIAQVVETQVAVNRLMSRLSWVFLVVLLLVGGASIASVMYANVAERRREIGTLMALGASPGTVARMFLGKATLLGIAGGAIGFTAGTILAVALGPALVEVNVQPMPLLGAIGMMTATIIAIAASYLPARRAASLDPCLVFNNA